MATRSQFTHPPTGNSCYINALLQAIRPAWRFGDPTDLKPGSLADKFYAYYTVPNTRLLERGVYKMLGLPPGEQCDTGVRGGGGERLKTVANRALHGHRNSLPRSSDCWMWKSMPIISCKPWEFSTTSDTLTAMFAGTGPAHPHMTHCS